MAQLDCAACLEGDKHHVRQRRQQQQQEQEEEEEDIEDMEEGREKKGKEGTTAATNMFPRATPSLQAVMMMMHGPFAEAFEGAMALSKRMENSTKEVFANARTVALQNQVCLCV